MPTDAKTKPEEAQTQTNEPATEPENSTQSVEKSLPDIRPGDTVKVYHRFKEITKKGKKSVEEKEKTQMFEGVVIARKHGRGITSTITVRRIIAGVGVEKIFPLHSPTIEKIEIISRAKVRRAKLYYLRDRVGKKARLKRKELKVQNNKSASSNNKPQDKLAVPESSLENKSSNPEVSENKTKE